jgi:hypothetical protein
LSEAKNAAYAVNATISESSCCLKQEVAGCKRELSSMFVLGVQELRSVALEVKTGVAGTKADITLAAQIVRAEMQNFGHEAKSLVSEVKSEIKEAKADIKNLIDTKTNPLESWGLGMDVGIKCMTVALLLRRAFIAAKPEPESKREKTLAYLFDITAVVLSFYVLCSGGGFMSMLRVKGYLVSAIGIAKSAWNVVSELFGVGTIFSFSKDDVDETFDRLENGLDDSRVDPEMFKHGLVEETDDDLKIDGKSIYEDDKDFVDSFIPQPPRVTYGNYVCGDKECDAIHRNFVSDWTCPNKVLVKRGIHVRLICPLCLARKGFNPLSDEERASFFRCLRNSGQSRLMAINETSVQVYNVEDGIALDNDAKIQRRLLQQPVNTSMEDRAKARSVLKSVFRPIGVEPLEEKVRSLAREFKEEKAQQRANSPWYVRLQKSVEDLATSILKKWYAPYIFAGLLVLLLVMITVMTRRTKKIFSINPIMNKKILCRFGNDCVRTDCKFLHSDLSAEALFEKRCKGCKPESLLNATMLICDEKVCTNTDCVGLHIQHINIVVNEEDGKGNRNNNAYVVVPIPDMNKQENGVVLPIVSTVSNDLIAGKINVSAQNLSVIQKPVIDTGGDVCVANISLPIGDKVVEKVSEHRSKKKNNKGVNKNANSQPTTANRARATRNDRNKNKVNDVFSGKNWNQLYCQGFDGMKTTDSIILLGKEVGKQWNISGRTPQQILDKVENLIGGDSAVGYAMKRNGQLYDISDHFIMSNRKLEWKPRLKVEPHQKICYKNLLGKCKADKCLYSHQVDDEIKNKFFSKDCRSGAGCIFPGCKFVHSKLNKNAVEWRPKPKPEMLNGRKKMMATIDAHKAVFLVYKGNSHVAHCTCINAGVCAPQHVMNESGLSILIGDKFFPLDHTKVRNFSEGETQALDDEYLAWQPLPKGIDNKDYRTLKVRPVMAGMNVYLPTRDHKGTNWISTGQVLTQRTYSNPTVSGDCGSPLIDENTGHVVGIHVAGDTAANCFIPITEKNLLNFKTNFHIAPTLSGATQ